MGRFRRTLLVLALSGILTGCATHRKDDTAAAQPCDVGCIPYVEAMKIDGARLLLRGRNHLSGPTLDPPSGILTASEGDQFSVTGRDASYLFKVVAVESHYAILASTTEYWPSFLVRKISRETIRVPEFDDYGSMP